MRRFITLFSILALGLLVACGGGDDDPKDSDGSSSSGSGSSSSSSSSGGSKDNFCTPEYADAVFEGFDPLDDAPLLWQVSAGTDGSLWGVDTDGLAWRSTDGREWTQHQKLPAVEVITALDHATAYALNGSDLLILTA